MTYNEADILRAVFSSVDEAIIVVDPEARSIVHCNDGVERIFGYPVNEVLGRSTRFLHVDDASFEQFGRLSEQTLDLNQKYRVQFTMRRKSGATFPAEISVTPVHPEQSWLSGVVSVICDITRRKRDDEARRGIQRRLRIILEQIPAIVWTTDQELNITSLMGHNLPMLGDNPDLFLQKNIRDILSYNVHYPETERAHELALGGDHGEFEIELNGTHFCGCTEPLHEEGEVRGVVGLAYDITDQRRREESLANTIAEKEELIREIHHRVKNNLQILQSMLSIQHSQSRQREAKDALSIARQRVRSLADAYDELLRGETFGTVKMQDYITSIAHSLRHAAGPGIRIDVVIDDIELHTDTAIPCGMIVNELVTDSIVHSFVEQTTGTISIMLKLEGQEVVIVVRDNGPGKREVVIDEPDSTGLLLVDALVSQLGGTASLTHDAGRTVEVRFVPKAPSADPSPE